MEFDPHNPEQVRERKLRRKARADQETNDLTWVLSDPRGRRFLQRVMTSCGVLALSYVSTDPLATAFREGQRHIGLMLHAALTNAGQDIFRSVMEENISSHD